MATKAPAKPRPKPAASPTIETPQEWAQVLLQAGGYPVNASNVNFLTGWYNAEGGNWLNTASFNPINTTLGSPASGVVVPGSKTINSDGVQAYTSWAQGIAATLSTLQEARYSSIQGALAKGNASQALSSGSLATALHIWSGSAYSHIMPTDVGVLKSSTLSSLGAQIKDKIWPGMAEFVSGGFVHEIGAIGGQLKYSPRPSLDPSGVLGLGGTSKNAPAYTTTGPASSPSVAYTPTPSTPGTTSTSGGLLGGIESSVVEDLKVGGYLLGGLLSIGAGLYLLVKRESQMEEVGWLLVAAGGTIMYTTLNKMDPICVAKAAIGGQSPETCKGTISGGNLFGGLLTVVATLWAANKLSSLVGKAVGAAGGAAGGAAAGGAAGKAAGGSSEEPPTQGEAPEATPGELPGGEPPIEPLPVE